MFVSEITFPRTKLCLVSGTEPKPATARWFSVPSPSQCAGTQTSLSARCNPSRCHLPRRPRSSGHDVDLFLPRPGSLDCNPSNGVWWGWGLLANMYAPLILYVLSVYVVADTSNSTISEHINKCLNICWYHQISMFNVENQISTHHIMTNYLRPTVSFFLYTSLLFLGSGARRDRVVWLTVRYFRWAWPPLILSTVPQTPSPLDHSELSWQHSGTPISRQSGGRQSCPRYKHVLWDRQRPCGPSRLNPRTEHVPS